MPTFASTSNQDYKGKALSLCFLVQLHSKHYIPDVALDALIKFLFVFLSVLTRIAPSVEVVKKFFPRSLYHLHNFESFSYDKAFTKYVVCPNSTCNYLYHFEEAVSKVGTNRVSNKCSHIHFPKHPFPSQRKPCHATLLKKVTSTTGKEFLYPYFS